MPMVRRRDTRPLLTHREGRDSGQGFSLWGLLVAVLLAVLFHAPVLSNGFTYDDFRSLVHNPCIGGDEPLSSLLVRDVWCLEGEAATGSWRPLTGLVLRGVHHAAGLSTWAFHGLSLALYGLLTALVYALAFRLSERGRVAFLCALLFAAHPVHTEAVASISAMGDLLAALIGLAAVYIQAGLIARPEENWRRVAAFVLVWVAVLAKESAITLFGVLALLEAWRWWRPSRQVFRRVAASPQSLFLSWGLWLPLLALYLLLRYRLFGSPGALIQPEDNPLAALSGLSHVATAFSALGEYLRLLVYPLRLSVDYGYNQIPALSGLTHPDALWPLAVLLLSLLVALGLFIFRFFVTGFAIGFVWVTLSLPSNLLVSIPTLVAERLLLVPSLGLCLLLALLLDRAAPRPGGWARWVALLLLVGLVAAMGWRSLTRSADWHDNRTLFETSVAATPNSRKLRINAAYAWRLEGDWNRALRHYRHADTIAPERRDLFLERELGLCYHGLGNFGQALFHYDRALARLPGEVHASFLALEARARRIPVDLKLVPPDIEPPREPPPPRVDAVSGPARFEP